MHVPWLRVFSRPAAKYFAPRIAFTVNFSPGQGPGEGTALANAYSRGCHARIPKHSP
jgi:hypothetical protein